MELPKLIYRLVNDVSFRNLMRIDPEKAAAIVGVRLNREELEALAGVPWEVPFSTLMHPIIVEPKGPDGWWISQFSHGLIQQPRPSSIA